MSADLRRAISFAGTSRNAAVLHALRTIDMRAYAGASEVYEEWMGSSCTL